jgi:hypothetical protein
VPKDECDPEDPLELVGVELAADERELRDMALCFAEEFVRDGWSRAQILAMFQNPFYTGPHLAWKQKGDAFVEEIIEEAVRMWHPETRSL